jgi:glutaredoxin
MSFELVMYSRTTPCPYVSTARRVLAAYNIPYRELFIDQDEIYKQRVLDWTGFLSVPTLIVAHNGQDLPYTTFAALPQGASPRGVNRGPMLTEANEAELVAWLRQHGWLP